ncbi:hypothetical protein KIH41_12585 [Litoribacter ruber]|uniref:hypothetical protein n=1 Tax=Litoribacter ruber TaxID=702568 RepID=UPI001BDA08E7|nr:hypothetical protein [Litoribacter ruber]MBT0812113.1 hypothetical protein [Litoribacter ruber]
MMKYSVFICLMAVILFSACQEDDSITTETSVEGQWELQGFRSNWIDDMISVDEMDYSDSYTFRADGSFTKFNSVLGSELSGTFEEIIPAAEVNVNYIKRLKLSFNPEDLEEVLETDEAGNLHGWNQEHQFSVFYGQSNIEELILLADGTLANAGYRIADGSIYIYKRM